LPRAVEFTEYVDADLTATQVAEQYVEWDMYREGAMSLSKEVREYIFATSTKQTSVAALPWKNSVHIPKLCQIRDNLYANYTASLFPHDKYMKWEGEDKQSNSKAKRKIIQAYIQNKLRTGQAVTEINKCVLDWIDYGNCFAMVEYANQTHVHEETGEVTQGYVGPKIVRVSPEDIVFDPTVAQFENSPKIIRSIMTLGDLKATMEENPEKGYLQEIFDRVLALRAKFKNARGFDIRKNSQFIVDGFTSFMNYFNSNYVEVLDFYGDIYDPVTHELQRNRCVSVVDRAYIIRNVQQPSWLGTAPIFHCGWRIRPDNLYAMGPLDNLVGLQYRIDHLENAKADGFDMIMHPVMKIKGMVEDFEYGPSARVYVGDDGDVEFMHPDPMVLQADTQIMMYEQKMEEMAGAPKTAMGFRTPGEKTAFEMQILENGANKIFINKTSYFEEKFLERIYNAFLEVARRNIGPSETIRVADEDFNYKEFLKVTKEDITARGLIRPMGARRFARNANLMQNLTQLMASPLGQDPAISVHFSGKKMAHLVQELLGLDDFELVQDNVRVIENAETQQLQASAQQTLMEKQAMPVAQPGGQIPGAPAPTQGSAPKAPAAG
jgi:hypothetical protein